MVSHGNREKERLFEISQLERFQKQTRISLEIQGAYQMLKKVKPKPKLQFDLLC
jgi:hypothetical protein